MSREPLPAAGGDVTGQPVFVPRGAAAVQFEVFSRLFDRDPVKQLKGPSLKSPLRQRGYLKC